MDAIKAQADRSYLPYQTQVELYRHAYTESVLGGVPTPGLFESKSLMEKSRDCILEELEKVRPLTREDGPTTQDIEQLKSDVGDYFRTVIEWHASVDERLRHWLGGPPDVVGIRCGTTRHVLLDAVAAAFLEGHLLPKVTDECRSQWRDEYLQRIKQDDPVGPGKTDQHKESTDLAAGDYFMWREIVEHCRTRKFCNGFIFVTEERKLDLWESKQTDRVIRRIDPRIQAEAIADTGGPMYVVSFDEFLEYTTVDDAARQMLVEISEDAQRSRESTLDWSADSYASLLDLLTAWGNSGQRDVIIAAARQGGSISRAEIGEVLKWDGENRYLTRFRMPADRAKRQLVREQALGEDAPDPLWALYDGPGEAVAYAVPDEFAELQSQLDAEKQQ